MSRPRRPSDEVQLERLHELADRLETDCRWRALSDHVLADRLRTITRRLEAAIGRLKKK